MNLNSDITLLRIKYSQPIKSQSTLKSKSSDDPANYNKELKKAADGFEELFVHQLMKEMRKSIPKTDLMDGGRGEEIFQDMLDQKYSQIITESGGLGLSDVIYQENRKETASTPEDQAQRDLYRPLKK